MKVPKFNEYISEQKDESYNKLVLLTHSGASVRDTKDDPDTRFELLDAAKKLGLTVFIPNFVATFFIVHLTHWIHLLHRGKE